jgi:hypothetical protein
MRHRKSAARGRCLAGSRRGQTRPLINVRNPVVAITFERAALNLKPRPVVTVRVSAEETLLESCQMIRPLGPKTAFARIAMVSNPVRKRDEFRC